MVTGVTNSTSSTTGSLLTGAQQGILDRNAFLKLLITQMQYQDPMQPMDNTEFVSQLAQFSSLEQMQNMNQGFDKFGKSAMANQAFSMVGKWVDYSDPNTGTTVTGKVTGVSFYDGTPVLKVGTQYVTMGYINTVYPSFDAVGDGRTATQALQMIGKTVDYLASSGSDQVLTGKIVSVSFDDGRAMANIGSQQVDFSLVLGIHQDTGDQGYDDALALAQALVDRLVEYTVDGTTRRGTVQGMSASGGWPQLQIDNRLIDVGAVTKVF